MQTGLIPNLWFDGNAREAAEFYVSVFPNSKIDTITRYTDAGPGEPGSVMVVDFTVNGQRLIGINGGPQFPFSEAISLLVECDTQEEIDEYWDAIVGNGGQEGPCGWCKDRYGLSWQIAPTGMDELFADADRSKAERATRAMFGMKKLILADLLAAAEGTPA